MIAVQTIHQTQDIFTAQCFSFERNLDAKIVRSISVQLFDGRFVIGRRSFQGFAKRLTRQSIIELARGLAKLRESAVPSEMPYVPSSSSAKWTSWSAW